MKKQFKLGVIGCEKPATALIRGVVLSDFIREKKIIVGDKSEKELDKLDYLGVRTSTDLKYVAENSEYVVLALKPDKFFETVKELGGYCPEKVISLMPSVTKSAIKNAIGIGPIRVVRCSVNMPASIGSGAIGIDFSDFTRSMDDTDFVSNAFNTLGTVVDAPESKLDAVSALSDCGCACVFMFIDAMVTAGVKLGLSKEESKILAVQTAFGCSELASRDENTLEELVMQSGSGAAIQAVMAFENNNLSATVSEAVRLSCNKLSSKNI